MGNKIFVSYKFSDNNVAPLNGKNVTVRQYVDLLETYFDDTNHIYKGESDGEDLSNLSDIAIWERLKLRIFDSSVTIVMISPNMKDPLRYDKSQWIPWEISYSLKEMTRSDNISHTNAVLAIVLPDYFGRYDYFIRDNHCCSVACRTLMTDKSFKIMASNMFNRKQKKQIACANGKVVWAGENSYISSVTWNEFCQNPNLYINRAIAIRDDVASYDIVKEV